MFLKHPAAPRTNTACHNLSLHDALPCSADLVLTDPAIGDFRTFARLSPPLRSEDDRHACLAAIEDGTIDILSSGHDPRGPEDKRVVYEPVELAQDLRQFDFMSPWEGAEYVLPGDEQAEGKPSTCSRSEERRVGNEWVRECRCRWSTVHLKKK